MHARVVLGVGKGVLFREVSSVQECPHREREVPLYAYASLALFTATLSLFSLSVSRLVATGDCLFNPAVTVF